MSSGLAGFEGGLGLLLFAGVLEQAPRTDLLDSDSLMPSAPMPLPRRLAWLVLLLALLAAGLSGCRKSTVAPGDPVAAVEGLAQSIRDNDLVRYSRLSLPPELHRKMEARWKQKLAIAPPPRPEQVKDYARWMGRLTADDAETALYKSLDPKLARLDKEIGAQWPLMKATATIFLNGVIQANDHLSPHEKQHALAVGAALMAWAKPGVFTDRERAKQAIAAVTRTARDLELPTLAQARKLEMIPALEKAGIGLKGLKAAGRAYGVDADDALDHLTAKVESVDGDIATMHVTYPLFGQEIAFDMELLRRDGRWYPADAVRQAEAELGQPRPAAKVAAH
jgi:hypothetical protein